jgi:hypothetical protein
MKMTSLLSWSNLRRAIAALLLGCGLAGRAQTPHVPAPPAPVPLTQRHIFKVVYDDAVEGQVSGKAYVDWGTGPATGGQSSPTGARVAVRINSPLTGKDTWLYQGNFAPPDASGQVEFRFADTTPPALPIKAPATKGLPQMNLRKGDRVSAQCGGSSVSAVAAARDRPDYATTVSLSAEEDGTLLGRWHYRADPITERNLNGGGRVGSFLMPSNDTASFLGIQSGREEWTPLRPYLYHVAVVEDQTRPFVDGNQVSAMYGYPKPGARDSDRRRLVIFGADLPVFVREDGTSDLGFLEPIKSDPDDLTFTLVRFYNRYGAAPASRPLDDEVEAALRELTAGKDEATAKAIRQLEVAVVDVRFRSNVAPGVRTFTWNGVPGTWRLEFGDNTAQVRVVRRLMGNDRSEGTPVVFLPEVDEVEVETAQVLPFDSLKLFIVTNGTIGTKPLIASRQGGPNSRLYRTDPVAFVGTGQSIPGSTAGEQIPAKAGDKITFVAEQQRGIFIGATQADVTVYDSPDALPAPSNWNLKLSECAKMDGQPDTHDWAHLPGHDAGNLETVFFTSLGTKKTNLTLGQHAAMLMLRDLFTDLMARQLISLLKTRAGDDASLGFGKTVADSLRRNPNSLFATLPAGTLNGAAVTLLDAVNDAKIDAAFPKDQAAARKWRIGAFQAGLTSYMASVQAAIDQAASVKDREFKDLLKLTGRDFEPVVAQLLPRMVRRNPDTGAWEADRIARGYITSVAPKEKEFEDLKEASKIDTQITVQVAGLIVGAPAMISESAVAAFITWAGNGLMWSIEAANDIVNTYEIKKEVGFAAGAAVVLGEMRYDEAKLVDTAWWKLAASILWNAVNTRREAMGVLAKFDRELSVARGLRVIGELDGGVTALRRLSDVERADVEAAAMEAEALLEAGKAVSQEQARALFTWKSYSAEMMGGPLVLGADWLRTVHLRAGLLEPERQGVVVARTIAAADADATATQALRLAVARHDHLAAEARAFQAEASELAVLQTYVKGDKLKAIADDIKEVQSRAAVINDILALNRRDSAQLLKLTDAEVAWITGVQEAVDVDKMNRLLTTHDNSWEKIKSAYEHRDLSASDMHQFVTWRRQTVDRMADDVIAEVEKEMTATLGRPVKIKRQAFGSTNLTSDYDISVVGPGAERVIGRFNERFRAANKNLESAFVFDTNLYTDPVYKLFKARALNGGSLALGTVELDTVRQFTYNQMAMRKYTSDELWEAHKKMMFEAGGQDAHDMLAYAFNQAEHGYKDAQKLIYGYLGPAIGANALYQAQNRAYAQVLSTIDQWELEMARLDGVFVANAPYTTMPPTEFLDRFPVYKARLQELNERLVANDLENARLLRSALEEEVIAQMRDAQGTALFFASEAYQSSGTIIHVVGELQGPTARVITAESLLSKPIKTGLDELSYLDSFYENRANMYKEFNHLGLFGDGKLAPGPKLAAKGSKYVIRQLDAVKQAGIDLNKTGGAAFVALVVEIDKSRGELKDVEAILTKAGITGEQFAKQCVDVTNQLAAEGVRHTQFHDLATYLAPQFQDLNRLEGLSSIK